MQVAQRPLFIEHSGEWWEFCGDTFEEHVDSWQIVDGQVQKDKWKLSAVAASLQVKYNDKTVDRFAYETRRSARRIREYAKTYRAFENGERSPILSFHHHTVAATAGDPVEAINKAEDNEWSTRQLENWIKTGLEPDDDRSAKSETEKDEAPKPSPEMQKLHDDAVREELDGRIAVIRTWDQPVEPFLSTVYRRAIEMLEWQRDRTVDRDCAALITMLVGNDAEEDGTECASLGDMLIWLKTRCLLMSEGDVKKRIDSMLDLNMLQKLSRTRSKGKAQRGVVTVVYEVHPAYLNRMRIAEDASELPPTVSELQKEREKTKEPQSQTAA